MPPQAASLQSLLPAVRAVCGGCKVTSFQREKRPSDIIHSPSLRTVRGSPAPNTQNGGIMSKTKHDRKMTIRMSELTAFRLDRDYRLDGSRSKNEFIERAIIHALDTLEAEQSQTLPVALQSAIDGRLGLFEDRIAKLLFKLAVEMDMGLNALLDYLKIDPDYIHKLRARSAKEVKSTNGRLTFEQKVREDDEAWQD